MNPPENQSNTDRMLQHLEDGSFTADLVRAYTSAEADQQRAALLKVLKVRLEQARNDLEQAEDQLD